MSVLTPGSRPLTEVPDGWTRSGWVCHLRWLATYGYDPMAALYHSPERAAELRKVADELEAERCRA